MLETSESQSPAVRAAMEQLRSRLNVGRILVRYRIRKRWSQQELAERAGTKQSRVSELETLAGNVRFDTLDKIAAALGLEITLQVRTTSLGTGQMKSAGATPPGIIPLSTIGSVSTTTIRSADGAFATVGNAGVVA